VLFGANGSGSFSNPYSRCPQYLFCFVTLSAVEGLFSKQKSILAPIGAKKPTILAFSENLII
jgi:hypothetical protein